MIGFAPFFEAGMIEPYKIVVGLEVHVQLLTKTKLFCGCSTKFGAPPNSQVCPVCLGMPGSLPVMNRLAFDLSVRAAIALNCTIADFTKWDRKNYYYPDLPKNYQISQYDLPFSSEGWLEINAALDLDLLPRDAVQRLNLPARPTAEGTLAPIGTWYQARVRLDSTNAPLLRGAAGDAKILIDPQSLGTRIIRWLARTFG